MPKQEQPPITWQTTLVVVFCLVMTVMTFIWNLPPSDLQNRINKVTQYVMVPTGLWQSWGMFSTPVQYGFDIRVAKLYPSGQVTYEKQHVVQGVNYVRDIMRGFYLNILSDSSGRYIEAMLKSHCDDAGVLGTPSKVTFEVATLPVATLVPGSPNGRTFPIHYQQRQSVTCPAS